MSENRLAELTGDGRLVRVVPVPLAKPFTACFTTTVRGGSPPSNLLELLGTRAGQHATISYARINLGGL